MSPQNGEIDNSGTPGRRDPCVALVIPTYNAGQDWDLLCERIRMQRAAPQEVIIIDSSSPDGTGKRAADAGFTVIEIERNDFNHGRTRQAGVERAWNAEILIYLTQDAIPRDPETFRNILAVFEDPSIGAAYGRQLPRDSANCLEAHARLFNYPGESRVRTWESRRTLGFKSIFLSNSFAAYRRSALMSVGGFPPDVIFGEDTVVAARLHRAGWKTAYVAEAVVNHSHCHSIREEFERYFDIGVLHAREHWLVEEFGAAESEGARFAMSELRFLWNYDVLAMPSSVIRTICKYAGYQAGRREKQIASWLKRHLGRNKEYWIRPSRAQLPQ